MIQVFLKDLTKYKFIYLMALPGLLYYAIHDYWPMYGATIAFKQYVPTKGIMGSPWVGFEHFAEFFNSYYFERIIINTLLISLYSIVFGFPMPIILALLLNEVRKKWFKGTVQTITYLPHFISVVIISGMLIEFSSKSGLFNDIIEWLGGSRENLLLQPGLFRLIFVSSGIWQEIGWGSIIYLAALTGISPELYEAARMDGAGRWKQLIHVTLPGITTTIVILLILRLGQVMNVGFEKVILLYNPATFETADVISTFVYRKGLIEANYSYSAAVGLFNSIINFIILLAANRFSKKISGSGLF
ncbi:ABC transporter permease subunit [Bacillus sp. 3255]|uniref:ABC transporter permease n=1 Tax=Bacillus sp. 3255 TaxID=2817904 RepID=UPI002859668C|nr:ABC transporter permease subunit [Bacillus sp. 3255]MDR6882425.1 putative aldouronate transport system permease protein [Bacillus sp. 3255]